MNFFRLLQAALLLLAAPCAGPLAEAQDNSQQQNQTIRVSVDRVNVGVIVTDHSGHFVEGLRREDFHVFDNGTEQPLTRVENGSCSLHRRRYVATGKVASDSTKAQDLRRSHPGSLTRRRLPQVSQVEETLRSGA